ncbi:MAG: hypothetical protein Q8Q09_18680 [Deltaproteobacteria bacterium]|nr:hypothetical protein [Deltaproteobacteria bacterium]
MATLARLSLLTALYAGWSCAPGIPNERVIRGRFVEVHVSEADAPCDGSIAYADRFVERWAARFGVAPPQIRVFFNDARRAFACPDYHDGSTTHCVANNEVFVSTWVHSHELIHAIAGRAFGRAPAFLEEGLAVWATDLGDENGNLPSPPGGSLACCLESATWNQNPLRPGLYSDAGRFVAFLVARFGLSAVLRVYDSLDHHASLVQINAAFDHEFSQSSAALLSEWRAATEPQPTGDERVRMLCESAPMVDAAGELPLPPSACRESSPWGVESPRVISLDGGLYGLYGLSLNGTLAVGRCDRGVAVYDGAQPDVLWMPAGRVMLSGRGDSPLQVRALASAPTRCATGAVLAMGARSTLRLVAAPSAWMREGESLRSWIRVRHDTAARVRVSLVFNASAVNQQVTVRACSSCEVSAVCAPRTPLTPLTVDATSASLEVLELTASAQASPVTLVFDLAN